MKSLLPTLLLFAGISCTPTKRVQVVTEDLAPVPSTIPDGDGPPLAQLGDGIVQNDELEDYGLKDAFKLQTATVAKTAYISIANDVNLSGDIPKVIQGVEMALNTLSTEQSLCRVRELGEKSSLLAINLNDCFGKRGNEIWKLIEDTAVLRIQSQTTRGKQLQFLTGKRIPIMHASVFMETAFTASNYYNIQKTPLTENEFWDKQGIDRQGDFDERDPDILLAGTNNSLIAPGHNRSIRRLKNTIGLPCWNTYDVDSLKLVPESNFSAFPFPVEARSQKTFVFNAGEIICLKENGFMTFALYSAAGNRADAAPTTVVVNTRAAQLGLDVDIKIRDCLGCHANTMILPFRDEIRKVIADNPFAAQDKLLGNIFFKPQADIESQVAEDNSSYTSAIGKLNISPGGPDSMTAQLDQLRNGADLKELAAFLYLGEDDFRECLDGSQNASSQVGALLDGGTLPFFQLKDALKDIIDDCNLFKETQE